MFNTNPPPPFPERREYFFTKLESQYFNLAEASCSYIYKVSWVMPGFSQGATLNRTLTCQQKSSNTTRTVYYLQTDYQGLLVAVYNSSGTLNKQFSYNESFLYPPCPSLKMEGTMQISITAQLEGYPSLSREGLGVSRNNPADWNDYTVTTETLFTRGYTGHSLPRFFTGEHLDNFGLINMNGRVYDPRLARFLSPDNYVQDPENSQSYNRYAYCINNPMKYTDPSGDFSILGIGTIGFIKGFIRSLNGRHEDGHHTWFGDAFASSFRHAGNSVKIQGGLFAADTKQSGWFWQIPSRLFKQTPQTVLGLAAAEGANIFGQVNKVDYCAGATVLQHEGSIGGAFTLGSYIQGGPDIEADPSNAVFQHEYGHYLQSQEFGHRYLGSCALPSLISAFNDNNDGTWNHSYFYTEQDANLRALAYWKAREDNYTGWNFRSNPILKESTLINARWYDINIFYTGFYVWAYMPILKALYDPNYYTSDKFIYE
jgi:RHS repeat-associated protein